MKIINGIGAPISSGRIVISLLAGLSGCAPVPVVSIPAPLEARISKCIRDYYRDDRDRQKEIACTAVIQSSDTTPKDLQRAFYYRGVAYQAQGRPDYAILDFTRAIQLQPNDINALRDRCEAYVDDAQPDLAIRDCNRAILLDPGDRGPDTDKDTDYLNRGRAYAAKAQYARAIADFNRGIPNYPCMGSVCYLLHMNRGRAYRALGQPRRAEADFARARRTRMSID